VTEDGRSDRIADKLKRRLPEALFEAVFVVFAVLVALGVDQVRERRQELQLAERAKQSVVGEIQENVAELVGAGEVNRSLQRSLQEALAAERAGELMGLTGIEYEVSLLGADAWETARTTRAVHFMDSGREGC
jgi:hypothetical protein